MLGDFRGLPGVGERARVVPQPGCRPAAVMARIGTRTPTAPRRRTSSTRTAPWAMIKQTLPANPTAHCHQQQGAGIVAELLGEGQGRGLRQHRLSGLVVAGEGTRHPTGEQGRQPLLGIGEVRDHVDPLSARGDAAEVVEPKPGHGQLGQRPHQWRALEHGARG